MPENAPSPLTVPSDGSSSSEGDKDAFDTDEPQWFAPSKTDWSPDDAVECSPPVGVDEDVFLYLEQQRQSQGRHDLAVKGSPWKTRIGRARARSTPDAVGSTTATASPLTKTISFGRVRSSFWRQTLNAPTSHLPPAGDMSSQAIDLASSRRVKFLSDTEDDLFSVATPIIDSDDGTAEEEAVAAQSTMPDVPVEPIPRDDHNQYGCFSKELLITYAKLIVSDATACCNV